MIALVWLCCAGLTWGKPELTPPLSSMKFQRMIDGQYVVDVYINGQGPFDFMIDTAASRSSLLAKTARTLNMEVPDDQTRLVSGIVMAKHRPIVQVQSMRFGSVHKTDHDMVILSDWPMRDSFVDGIVGMDILGDLILTFNHKDQTLSIFDKGADLSKAYRRWSKVKLAANPYHTDDYGLKFIDSQIGHQNIPAILDLGSGFSAVNWKALTTHSALSRQRARMFADWEIQGANGDFRPKVRLRTSQLQLGRLTLHNRDLIVMDFDHLPLNNFGEHPLLIAGADLINNHDFVLDFANDFLYVKAKKTRLNSAFNTMTVPGPGFQDGNVRK